MTKPIQTLRAAMTWGAMIAQAVVRDAGWERTAPIAVIPSDFAMLVTDAATSAARVDSVLAKQITASIQ